MTWPALVGEWPAPPGEQREWEPPRTATGVPSRVARLKALGNGMVPMCAAVAWGSLIAATRPTCSETT